MIKELYAKAAARVHGDRWQAIQEYACRGWRYCRHARGHWSDFARLEVDTKAAETSAQREYDESMTDSQVDKTKKSTDIEHKIAKKRDEEPAAGVYPMQPWGGVNVVAAWRRVWSLLRC